MLIKYKSSILYLFFGALTTVVNILVYSLAYYILDFNNVSSNIISWILSVLFAFFTNKVFVFKSECGYKKTISELIKFFVCRILSGVFETVMMVVLVDMLFFNALIVKIILTVIVVLANYFFSKKIIFAKK